MTEVPPRLIGSPNDLAETPSVDITMGSTAVYLSQLRAMLIRNLLIKKRDFRKTLPEVFYPLYIMAMMILGKMLIPNPNYPALIEPTVGKNSFMRFNGSKNHTIAIAPNSTETLNFLAAANALWTNTWDSSTNGKIPAIPLNFVMYNTTDDLRAAYWRDSQSIPMAVVFEDPEPISNSLLYKIKSNPSVYSLPSPKALHSSPIACRKDSKHLLGDALAVLADTGDACPVDEYLASGFIALQMLLDTTKIRFDSGNNDIQMPSISFGLLPKAAYTADWMLIFRIVVPSYMVIALSQFIAYLLVLIVGEKENKIKEGMCIMGLKNAVFWISWFIIYSIFVFLLSAVAVLLLFTLQMFQHTHFLPLFLLMTLYSFSVIMIAFMITPFFDKARTAGVLGTFLVTGLSLMYFIHVFYKESGTLTYWLISLISPAGVALALDKALVSDLKGEGVNFNNLWKGPGISFGGSLIMMVVDMLVYGFLAYYLDSVIPSEYGVKRPVWFCFLPEYWCKKKVLMVPSTNGESNTFVPGEEVNHDIEPVAREMKGREAIRIINLYKTYQTCRQPEIKSVNGINLTIYEGQITAILGHNGAGKTTLFNILTGLTAPTSGTALVFGYDIRDYKDMQVIRSKTGVCPQHDILFDLLTPREHLQFFARVRGLAKETINEEVTKILDEIDLVEKADVYSKRLSGGQKRKLSVGIAIIGDPKIIILDEPTAGVDPISRRQLWSVLQARRHGRVMLLTTHFMDEADILADRKAVISKGKLRCCGSSLFLKNKFGIGYHLTMVLEGTCREQAITRLILSHVTKAEKARRHGRELSFILPHNSVENFPLLFAAIENEIKTKASRLGISTYGVSMTTLEEVFLHLEKDEEVECAMDNLSKKMVKNRALSRSLSLQSKSTSYQSLQNEGAAVQLDGQSKANSELSDGLSSDKSPVAFTVEVDPLKIRPNFTQITLAMLSLRFRRLIRDYQTLFFTIAIPLALTAFTLTSHNSRKTTFKEQSIELNNETYGDGTKILYVNDVNSDTSKFLNEVKLNVKNFKEYNGNFSHLLKISPHLGLLSFTNFDNQQFDFTVEYNDTMQHSLPILTNIITNSYYRMVMTQENPFKPTAPIKVKSHPFQPSSPFQDFNFGNSSTAILIGLTFALIPTIFAVDMVYDREIKAKNLLRVNGLSFPMYFFSYFIVLLCLIFFVIGSILVMIFLFDVPALTGAPALITLCSIFLLYCPASILFSSSLSYIFDKMDSAQSILPNIVTVTGLIAFFMTWGPDILGFDGYIFFLHIFFSLFNTVYVPFAAVYYIERVYLMCSINATCHHLTMYDYLTKETLIMAFGLILHCPLWYFIMLILDIKKSGGNVKDVFKYFGHKNSTINEDMVENLDIGDLEDTDVKAERQRVFDTVNSTNAEPPVILLQNLRKEYIAQRITTSSCDCCSKREEEEKVTTTAVRNMSFAVESGEVFGLLGHNGCGKTTTMKIVTGEESNTRGRVKISGLDVTSNVNEVFSKMGYCPQHDALWKNVTIKEHLVCYAAIRGIPRKDIDRIVDCYLTGLQIHEHANKLVTNCSGGTKRKLSFAIAMIGNPKMVLMDEPSTGMDPKSKRFLWDTILACFQQGKKGAILTTHSMEEADALCSRVGIMVRGELRCIGSTQHLKNLYGAGYTLEIKLRNIDCTPTTPSGDKVSAIKEFVTGLFVDSSLEESFADRIVFSVPQEAVKSIADCFQQLEKAKQEMDIEEYSFSQTTLEQVFLKFSHVER